MIDELLGPPGPVVGSLEAVRVGGGFDGAVLVARDCDRLGFAFVAGYQAALARLVGEIGAMAALCATEVGGAHPRAILTRLVDGRLTGEKQFVTLGSRASILLVVASTGAGDDGRNRLVLARVSATAPGVALEAMPPTPFAPEIPHARLRLVDAPVVEVLPGDGYERYLKPFRTIEDIHVMGAAMAYAFGVGRACGWPAPLLAEIVASLVALRGLAAQDPSSRGTHFALGGALAAVRALVERFDFAAAPEDVRARWLRDRPLLRIAENARTQRFAAAAAMINSPT